MSFTEFCCRSGGSNLNAGTVDGSSTEPATSALVTYTGGDWDSGTGIYTAPIGADLTEALDGRFASLYHDGDSSPTNNQYLVGRITAVNAGTRQITLSATARMLFGTAVASGTGNRSLRIGGAWSGPSGSSGFPFSTVSTTITGHGVLKNSSTNTPRFNFKNDQTYTMSGTLLISSTGPYQLWGYTTTFGDLGRAIFESPNGQLLQITGTPANVALVDLITRHTGTGTGHTIYIQGNRFLIWRCVVSASRQAGIWCSGNDGRIVECEIYDFNKSNGTGQTAGITYVGSAGLSVDRCIIHDGSGGNCIGVSVDGTGTCKISHSIIESNGGHGVVCTGTNTTVTLDSCDLYNNAGDGVRLTASSQSSFVAFNCNLVKNGGYGINNSGDGQITGLVLGCGFGSGTQANTSGAINNLRDLQELGTVNYASDITPWVDAPNGDFRITLSTAKGAGRGTFTQTASSYSGTVGYPDIGAAQAAASGGGARMVNIRGGADQ